MVHIEKLYNKSFEFFYELSVFPLGELESIDGNYAAVVSSRGYPNADTTRVQRFYIDNIPSDVYITYKLLTSAEQGFKLDQRVEVSGGLTRNIFNASLTAPFSQFHGADDIRMDSVRNTVDDKENPVFLIQFSGKWNKPKTVVTNSV